MTTWFPREPSGQTHPAARDGLRGTIDYLVEAVCTDPTLAEWYTVAALDAAQEIATLARMSG